MPPQDVHRIPLPTPFQIGDVNAWLLLREPLPLVDAGPQMEETDARLEEWLARRGHWLKAVGHARGPLREGWLEERPELLRRTGFPRRPRIVPGDRLVLYASVWRRVFAVVEALEEPEPRDHPRWPWTIATEPSAATARA